MRRKHIMAGAVCAVVISAFVVMIVRQTQEKSKTQHKQDLVDDMFHNHIRFTVESLRAKDMIHDLYGQLIDKNNTVVDSKLCKLISQANTASAKKKYQEIQSYINTNVIPFFNGVTKINDQSSRLTRSDIRLMYSWKCTLPTILTYILLN